MVINMIGGTERHLPAQPAFTWTAWFASSRRSRRELVGNGGEAFGFWSVFSTLLLKKATVFRRKLLFRFQTNNSLQA